MKVPRLNLFLEQPFQRAPGGSVWSNVGFRSSSWDRYWGTIAETRVVARTQQVLKPPTKAIRSDGPRVGAALPGYLGRYEYLTHNWRLRRRLTKVLSERAAFLFRVPSALAGPASPVLIKRGQPFGLEVVGDPFGASQMTWVVLLPMLMIWRTKQLINTIGPKTQLAR